MTRKIVECVPNFSEGGDRGTIDAICREIEGVAGCTLLDVDPGADTNRTVVTFVGNPVAAAEAAFRAVKRASELIDMRRHKGAHPRMGSTDVCPFVPVAGVAMEDCVAVAREVGERVGRELAIPVYLYEEASQAPYRKALNDIRAGEYEGLRQKLADPRWKPDFGPAEFNPRAGATVIGARRFLIAYNVNLNTRDRKLAHEIALNMREAGRAKRDEAGNVVRGEDGASIKVPGALKAVKAIGWYIEEYGCAQISVNLLDFKVTPLHAVFEEACRQAEKLGLRVTGSEIVGLVPKEAVLAAGRHFLDKQGKTPGVPENELVHAAVRSMGLRDCAPFEPDKKIIEYRLKGASGRLAGMTVKEFVDELSTDSPAPGGGSAAALCAAMSAALSSMVAALTKGRKEQRDAEQDMKSVGKSAQALKDRFLEAIDQDTDAFNKVMEAMRLPKTTPEEARNRREAVEQATKGAALVPAAVLKNMIEALELSRTVALRGNPNSLSDAVVAAAAGRAAAEGAYWNVVINLKSISDKEFADRLRREADEILAKVLSLEEDIRSKALQRLMTA